MPAISVLHFISYCAVCPLVYSLSHFLTLPFFVLLVLVFCNIMRLYVIVLLPASSREASINKVIIHRARDRGWETGLGAVLGYN